MVAPPPRPLNKLDPPVALLFVVVVDPNNPPPAEPVVPPPPNRPPPLFVAAGVDPNKEGAEVAGGWEVEGC